MIAEQWRRHWDHLITMFNYPEDIRRVIYTTNAIESVNSVIRKATTRHKMFPNNKAVLKVVYLAIEAAYKKWIMPIRNWCLALHSPKVAYETTWIDSEDFSIENTSFEVEHINSHQLGVGAGVDYKLSTANTVSVYLDYSHEFYAESRGSVQNVAIRSESLKGGTASADFLWNFAPDPHWDIDARMKLQTGKIEGISGLIHLGYRF